MCPALPAGADILTTGRTGAEPGLLGVIVVNYGSHQLIERNLPGALEQPYVRTIIVDNFVSGEEAEAIAKVCATFGWQLEALGENLGFGAAVNIGIQRAREAGCECFLFLNPDAVITTAALAELRRHSLAQPMALISPAIATTAGEIVFSGSRLNLANGQIRGIRSTSGLSDGQWVAWLPGTCLIIHEDLLRLAGNFDESFFLYWEDVDLSYRCAAVGGALIVRDDVVVVHDEGGTQGDRPGRAKSDIHYYYSCRNRILFAARHLNRRQLLRWMLLTPAQSWKILMRGGRRQLITSLAPLRSSARGSLAGLRLGTKALLAKPSHTSMVPTRPESPKPGPLVVTVAMLTYRRNTELDVVLPMILAQAESVSAATGDRCEVTVLVVDNDPVESARASVQRWDHPRLRYVAEHKTGISAARNRALDESAGADLLVFIDDDEQPREGWLAHLIDLYRATGAGMVAGSVVTHFPDDVDDWIVDGGFLDRRHRARVRTGTAVASAATNNLLIDLAQVRGYGLSFDDRFGQSGGEDSLFTQSFVARGGKIVWCGEAIVDDWLPMARMNRRWMLTRVRSHGIAQSRVNSALADGHTDRMVVKSKDCLGGIARIGVGSVRFLAGLTVRSNRHQARGLQSVFRGRGMVSGAFGRVIRVYGNE